MFKLFIGGFIVSMVVFRIIIPLTNQGHILGAGAILGLCVAGLFILGESNRS